VAAGGRVEYPATGTLARGAQLARAPPCRRHLARAGEVQPAFDLLGRWGRKIDDRHGRRRARNTHVLAGFRSRVQGCLYRVISDGEGRTSARGKKNRRKAPTEPGIGLRRGGLVGTGTRPHPRRSKERHHQGRRDSRSLTGRPWCRRCGADHGTLWMRLDTWSSDSSNGKRGQQSPCGRSGYNLGAQDLHTRRDRRSATLARGEVDAAALQPLRRSRPRNLDGRGMAGDCGRPIWVAFHGGDADFPGEMVRFTSALRGYGGRAAEVISCLGRVSSWLAAGSSSARPPPRRHRPMISLGRAG